MEGLLVMGQKELNRLAILERIKDRRLTQAETALMLGISDRQVRRLFKAYQAHGATALVSKHHGRKSNSAYDDRCVCGCSTSLKPVTTTLAQL